MEFQFTRGFFSAFFGGLFAVDDFQRAARGVLFGFLFALAGADWKDAFADVAADFKSLAVIGAAGADDRIMRRGAVDFLSAVLQGGFGIGIAAVFGAGFHFMSENAQHESARVFQTAVEIDGRGDRFK